MTVQHTLVHGDTQGAMESFQRCDSEHFCFMWLPEVPQSTLKRVQPFFFFLFKAKKYPLPSCESNRIVQNRRCLQ